MPPSTAPPPPKTSNVNLASSKLAKVPKAAKTGRVKKPLGAVALTQRNLHIFMRNVESNNCTSFSGQATGL